MDAFEELQREKGVTERLLKFLKDEYTKLEDENSMIKDTVDLGISEFENAMEVFLVHYDGFVMKSEVKEMDFKDLLFRKSVVDGQLKACMIAIDGLVQRIACLEEGRKVGFRGEQGDGKEKVGGFGTENNKGLVLGTQSGYWRKRGSELKEELKVYRARCEELSVKLENKKMECVLVEGKYKEMMSTNEVLDGKLKRYKNICYGSEQRIRHLDEERKAKCEIDKRVQERIANLEKELKMKEVNEKLKYDELIAVNRDLERGKERAEDEVKVLMKRLENLEKGELKKELGAYKNKCRGLSVELEKRKKEGGMNEAKLKDLMLEKSAVDEELKACKRTCDGLIDLIKGLEGEQRLSFKEAKTARERITYLEEEIKTLRSDEGKNCFELIKKTKDLECAKKIAENGNEVLREKVRDLETRVLKMEQVESEKAELEKDFEILLTKYEELSMDPEQKKMECVGVEDTRMCNELKEQIMDLKEALKYSSEKEKKDQELISSLEEEIKKMKSDDSEKYRQLKIENRDMECGKRRAEEEVESWRKRFRELETKVLRLKEVISTRCVDSQVSGGLQSDGSCNGKGEQYNGSVNLQTKTKSRTDGVHGDPLKIKEKMLNNCKEILSSSVAGCKHPSSLERDIDGHITGPASTVMQSRLTVNVKEEQNNTLSESRVEFRSSGRPASGGILGINDCEVRKDTTLKRTSNFRGIEMLYVSTDNTSKTYLDNEMDLQSRKRLKRPCSDLKGDKYSSSCEDDILSFSGLKRNVSKTVTSESENESEDDDKIPIAKLKMKKSQKLNEGVRKLSPLSHSRGNVTLSSRRQNVEESVSPSRQRLISLRQCKGKNSCGEKTYRNEDASPNRLQMSGTSYQNAENPTSDNGKENVAKDDASHSESERSLGGFISRCSDSYIIISDGGDSDSDSEHASMNQVIAMLKRNREEKQVKTEDADPSSFRI